MLGRPHGAARTVLPILEDQPQAKLNLPTVGSGPCDPTDGGAVGKTRGLAATRIRTRRPISGTGDRPAGGAAEDTAIHGPEVGAVEEVEELRPELKLHPFHQICVLEQGKVKGGDPRADQGIACHIAVEARILNDKGRGIEVFVRVPAVTQDRVVAGPRPEIGFVRIRALPIP